jgi:hypothetical protein
MEKMQKKHDLAKLEDLYNQAESVDSEIFAEMRSNLLLVAGDHYSKRQASIFRKIRDSKDLSEQQKLRLTKNHIQKITKTYANNILSTAPGVGFMPKNESELQDQKAAELHHSVWLDAQKKYDLDEALDDWCDDFIQVGEVHTKIFWDAQGGKLLGHQHATDEEGAPQYEEDGTPVKGDAVYEGEFIFEQIHGFNLLRAPEAKVLAKSPYLIIRKMVSVADLKARFPDQAKKIQESSDNTIVVFDGGKNGYRKANNEVMLKEIYFRPCAEYPRGYYYFWTKEVELTCDELPGGIFPIVSQAMEKIQTTPRGRSIIKVARPYQVEINRAASKMAEHQITLGDDKLIIVNGSEVSAGAALPGVRTIYTSGAEPKVMPGRDGSQYLAYMQAQIEEMYRVLNVQDDLDESKGQLEAFTLLFRSSKQKQRFQRYTKRFSKYLQNVAKTYLSLAKIFLPEDCFIQAAGKSELVNITEFKNSNDIGYEIVLDDQSDDIESKMGKQLVLNHMIQFAGAQLKPEDLGKLMRASPYANFEESFSDLTIDYDSATNMILALDRGERPQGSFYDNLPYMVKRFVSRTRQADFKQLSPEVQANYKQIIQEYEMAISNQQQQIQAAKDGYIPTGGYMVTVQVYVADPTSPGKTRLARVPYEAVQWLIKKLEAQGMGQQQLEQMNAGAMQQVAAQMIQQRGMQGAPPQPMPQPAMA